MTEIINGIVIILTGILSTVYMPSVCERHGEHGLAVGLRFAGPVLITVGALNVIEVLRPEEPGIVINEVVAEPVDVDSLPPVFRRPVDPTYATYADAAFTVERQNEIGQMDTIVIDHVISRRKMSNGWELRTADKSMYSVVEPNQKLIRVEE